MPSALQDVEFALRSFRRTPLFTGVALLTLAVGIGATAAMFTVANGILLRPLPIAEQDRVIVMWGTQPQRSFDHVPLKWNAVDRFARTTRAFESIGAIGYHGAWTWGMSERGQPAPIKGTWVTGGFFPLMRVAPQLGRVITAEDDVPNAPRVALISDGLWRRRYGADPAVLGRALDYQGMRFTIVGVAPRGFDYPRGIELWTAYVPFFPGARTDSGPTMLDVVGRLRPGATMEQGRREFHAFLEREFAEHRSSLGRLDGTARSFPELIVGDVRPILLALSAAVGLVLLIVCVNVANLLLARGAGRSREMAIRASLGAGRGRLIRQLLTESGVLAIAGALLGAALAVPAVRALVALAPPEVPRLADVAVDARVLAFVAAVTVASALLFGLAPALAVAGGRLETLLRGGSTRAATASRGTRRVKQALIVTQAALAALVLAGAGLLVRSLIELQRVDMGFAHERLLIAQLAMRWEKYPQGSSPALFDQVIPAAEAVPGVVAAAVLTASPYAGTGGWDAIPTADGQTEEERARNPWVSFEVVTAGYFETLRVPLQRGRTFARSDREGSPYVAVVNEAMAAAYWPGRDAIGQRIKLGARSDTTVRWAAVVGIVGNTRYRELRTQRPTLYLPNTQFSGPAPGWLAVRTAVPPQAVVPSLRRAFAAIDSELGIVTARTVREYLAGPLARPRFSTVLLGIFAVVALTLAAVGIYAVIGEYVRQRGRDIGIRVALGARGGDVRRLVLREGLQPALLGGLIGLAAALGSRRVLQAQLYEVRPTDPVTLGAAVGLVVAVALLACLVPARQATRVDPVDVLRTE